jgi:hypothetical protein
MRDVTGAQVPDGARLADYDYLRAVDSAGLMWEWLRRDGGYIAWYRKASAATRGAMPVPSRWRLVFAEDPARPAPAARILWRSDLDPGALRVIASPTRARDPAGFPLAGLRRWTAIVAGDDGREHAVVSDGLHHIRLDIEQGTLADGPVVLHYLLHGARNATAILLSLHRLMAVCLDRQFPPSLFPPDPRTERWILSLRIGDALRAGASQRDIAELLYGVDRARSGWHGASDSLRSRVRRLIGEARGLAGGGYRWMMREGAHAGRAAAPNRR